MGMTHEHQAGTFTTWFAGSALWSIGLTLVATWLSWVIGPRMQPRDYFEVVPIILAPWILTGAVFGCRWVIGGFRSN